MATKLYTIEIQVRMDAETAARLTAPYEHEGKQTTDLEFCVRRWAEDRMSLPVPSIVRMLEMVAAKASVRSCGVDDVEVVLAFDGKKRVVHEAGCKDSAEGVVCFLNENPAVMSYVWGHSAPESEDVG